MASVLAKELMRYVDEGAIDDFLKGVGLQRRAVAAGAFSTLGAFAAGLAVGAAVSLLYAPKSGVEMRNDLAQRMSSLREDVTERVQSVTKKGERYNPPS